MDAKVPYALTFGDKPQFPVSINSATKAQAQLAVLVNEKVEAQMESVAVPLRLNYAFEPSNIGQVNLTFKADTGKSKDAISKSILVLRRGFSQAVDEGGVLLPNQPKKHRFNLSLTSELVLGSFIPRFYVYTNPIGRLNKAIETLVAEPCGCFEQTSSTTFPLVFVLQYLIAHPSDAKHGLVDRAR